MPQAILVAPAVVSSVDMGDNHFVPVVAGGDETVPLVAPIHGAPNGRPHSWGARVPLLHAATFDPLISEIEWRSNVDAVAAMTIIKMRAVFVSDEERRERFWNFREELNEWAKKKARSDILVQRQKFGWLVVSTNMEDDEPLKRRLERDREHRVCLRFTRQNHVARFEAISKWVHANIKGEWALVSSGGRMLNTDPIIFLVRDLREASMLKLRWSDPTEISDGD